MHSSSRIPNTDGPKSPTPAARRKSTPPRPALEPLTPTNLATDALGRVTESRTLIKPVGAGMTRDRVLGRYAAVYVFEGGGFYQDANGLARTITAGDLILIFPDLPHRYGPDFDHDWHEHYLVFEGPVFDLWRSLNILNPRRPVIPLRPAQRWLTPFRAVATPFHIAHNVRVCRLQHTLALALATSGLAPDMAPNTTWADLAKAHLDEELDQPRDLHASAEELGLSYETFRKTFKQAVGMSPAQYMSHRQIERAKLLMETSSMTDRQIAQAVRFCDEFYFSRRFKQITGMTPTQYRAGLCPAAPLKNSTHRQR